MRRVPYASREWTAGDGRGVALSVMVGEKRFALRVFVLTKDEEALGVNVLDLQKAYALEALTREVSAEMGETVELYAG